MENNSKSLENADNDDKQAQPNPIDGEADASQTNSEQTEVQRPGEPGDD